MVSKSTHWTGPLGLALGAWLWVGGSAVAQSEPAVDPEAVAAWLGEAARAYLERGAEATSVGAGPVDTAYYHRGAEMMDTDSGPAAAFFRQGARVTSVDQVRVFRQGARVTDGSGTAHVEQGARQDDVSDAPYFRRGAEVTEVGDHVYVRQGAAVDSVPLRPADLGKPQPVLVEPFKRDVPWHDR